MQTLQFETAANGVATIWLDRPDRLNAISLEMVDELHRLLDRIVEDNSARVLILAGRGAGFCSGIDLKDDIHAGAEEVGEVQVRMRLQERLSSLIEKLRLAPQPVIAAVHGSAAGGGLALAAASDIRISDETAQFHAAFIRVGLSGGDLGLSWFLPRLVGSARASELLLTGRVFAAEEAAAIGFVTRVASPGEHLQEAADVAGQIVGNPPLGVRMTKVLLDRSGASSSLRAHLDLENRTQVLCSLTEDFAEGVAAFREKRPPQF